jgi:nucleoside-diphosphate-sugar epimerase
LAVWLVTGGSGFLGRHLLAALAEQAGGGVNVVCLGRTSRGRDLAGHFVAADLRAAHALTQVIADLEPSVVFHLAGQTPPAPPEQYFQGNTLATYNLLSALAALGKKVRVVVAGSAAELGQAAFGRAPIDESAAAEPTEPYGLSKWLATSAALQARSPLEVVAARIFNPIGPGMPSTLAFGRFADRLAGPGPDPVSLRTGDLEGRRDFIDARDVAQALLALQRSGRPGLVYHVGTGQSRRVAEGLERLIQLSGRAAVLEVPHQPASAPTDCRAATGRILAHTGWHATIPWEQSLADLWDEVRGRSALPLTPARAPV